ncbi:Isoleucine--tRNA ligase, cytoplasmic [Schistosoma japonicum]|uniref:Isoleucine--tRNA ligase, cytoplasmic n=1 Tax=Schistosoma japonicum TaxID=6182 RepID=A0A4Z2DFP7_SCHJA|nr:Isoleucine--tRNA ligase, cytoplasmic [Schistosoma japonicum]
MRTAMGDQLSKPHRVASKYRGVLRQVDMGQLSDAGNLGYKSQMPALVNIPEEEIKVLSFWESHKTFKTSLKHSLGKRRFTFYDGPPFATGLPHYGHLLAGTIKDIITRYAHQRGHHVERRFGWDCHGLPVEYEVDKELGITGPHDVEKMGIACYNDKCRSIVMRYSSQWEKVTNRLGRWIDFENDYRTMYPWFMESVWWVFKQLFDKGLVYRGLKVMPFSTACSTPLSNFEAGQNYKDVQDPAIIVSFPLDSDPETSMIAWTTTPWTLISNLALCIHPDKEYVKILDISKNQKFILLKARLTSLYKQESEYKILNTFKGRSMEGITYQPPFDYFIHLKKERGAFRVLCDTYVTEDAGTGVVHQAPYFGEDDFRVCLTNGIIRKDTPMICPVNSNGRFTDEIKEFAGMYVKDADKFICQNLKKHGRLVNQSTITHSYPFCWRSDTPLIYKAIPTWFIRVEQLVDRLLANNAKCQWVPDFVREGRFANWLREARDWAVSRNRFWGTPIPIWASEDMEEVICIGSIEELKLLSGVEVTDLHKEFVDPITIPSSTGRGVLHRISEVFDCWFESGSMPYAQVHYPFENTKVFQEGFPADFIAEGIDQTRGWFYTLLVLSTALFDQPPFRNLIVSGIVLASDGQKMSKRAKNYPDPVEVIKKHGADPLRLYLINSPVVRAQNLRFNESGVHESSILPYQKTTHQLFTVKPNEFPMTNNFMDCWILSFTQSLILFVHEELSGYRLYTVVPRLVKFIDHLVNWYVRMNRKRLKGDTVEDENDWKAALHTLLKVIYQITCLMSPFTPFMTEFIYQYIKQYLDYTDNLKDRSSLLPGYSPETGAPDSIHYIQAPEPKLELISLEIEDIVYWMQSTVELGRIIRTRCNLPLKAPLREAIVIHSDPNILNCVKSAQTYIIDELNVRVLTTTTDKHRYGVQLRGVLNHKTLGVRLKNDYKSVVNKVKDMCTEELEEFVNTGRLVVCGHELSGDDLSVVYSTGGVSDAQPNASGLKRKSEQQSTVNSNNQTANLSKYETASDTKGLLVILDTTPDVELENERLARELVNRIQRTRKKAELIPENPIVILAITDLDIYYNIAGPQGSYLNFIQSTIKQPFTIMKQSTMNTVNLVDIKQHANSVLPDGWELSTEVIRDTVSIPPDNIDLIIFSRIQNHEADNISATTVNNNNISLEKTNKRPMFVTVVNYADKSQTVKVQLRDSNNQWFVHSVDDLLRKIQQFHSSICVIQSVLTTLVKILTQ